MKTLVLVAVLVAAMCTAASAAVSSYANSTGGMVYELDAPTSWAISNGVANVVLTGGGVNGGDAYYRPGTVNGTDDGTKCFWNFGINGTFYAQVYNTDLAAYGITKAPDDVVLMYGNSINDGAWPGWAGMAHSSVGWNGFDWGGPTVTLTVGELGQKWNIWGGFNGNAVSGVRLSTNGDFTPEPSSLLALLAGLPALALLRRKH